MEFLSNLPADFWVGAVMVVLLAVAIPLNARHVRMSGLAEQNAFAAASRELRLECDGTRIAGTRGGVEIEVQGHNGAANTPPELLDGAVGLRRTRIVVRGIPAGLMARQPGTFPQTHPYPLVADDPVPTGDPAFDDHVYLTGPVATVTRAMTGSARRALREVVQQYGAELFDGELRIDRPGPHTDPNWIVEAVRAASGAVRAMQEGAQAGTAGLAALAKRDPVGGVRLIAFKQLQTLDPDAADRIAIDLLQEPNAELRLLAARRIGAPGLPVIRALIHPETEPAVVESAIRTLGVLEGPACAAFLETRLRWDRQRGVRLSDAAHIVAIEVLGDVGTVDTIAPLQEFSPAFGAVKRAVDAAISQIRSRMPAVEGGWVSLAEGGGEVSVVEEGDMAPSAARRRLPEG